MKISSRRRQNKNSPGRFFGVLLPGLLLLLLIAPATGFAQQGGISIGQTVEVTAGDGLNLRTKPGKSAAVITKLPYRTQMKVVGGPSERIDNYIWWELEGSAGRGWAAEDFLKVVSEAPAPGITPQGDSAGCVQPYPAIQYCPQKDKTVYAIKINLSDPHVRFETIMANDTKSVNTSNREYVSAMGTKLKEKGAVAVINADYFGAGHGPEGFTVVNGRRLDGTINGDGDNNSVFRSSIAFSKSELDGGSAPIVVGIQRFEMDAFSPSPNQIFNAVGGGPQIVFNGTWDWTRGREQSKYSDYPDCPLITANDDVINGECFVDTGKTGTGWEDPAKIWTVVGKTKDGHLLMLLALYPDVKSSLEKYQVQEAIKLDGGGSSQLWYNDQSIVKGGRPVANGLAVFYKNAYEVTEQPQFPVVVSGESLEIEIVVKNAGADTWTQKDYVFISTKNPWNADLEFKLPKDVKPGDSVTLTWQSDPIEKTWGIYSFDLQMTDQRREFPEKPINIRVIVLPQDLADKKKELEDKIREWRDKKIEDIEREILKWIERELLGLWQWLWNQIYLWFYENCYVPITTLIVAATILRRRKNFS